MNLADEIGLSDYKILKDGAALKVAQNWLKVFCIHRTSFKGVRGGKSYLWDEIHSDNQNADATAEFEKHFATSYYLMLDNFGENEKEIYVSTQKPAGNAGLKDFHVFPKNLAWSIAFTHEDGYIGPKFFKHSNYAKLNKENEKAFKELSKWRV
jgi:hypothetical protein